MIAADEMALICDFAEEYHIYDYKALPLDLCATLAAGLRDTSRIKAKLGGFNSTLDIMFLAITSDKLSNLVWFQTKDGAQGKNRPPSLYEAIMNLGKEEEAELQGFDSPEEFWAARNKLLLGG